MKEIGGYFELELPKAHRNYIHSAGIFTNSGRHALEYILNYLKKSISKIWLPYYNCDVVLQPILRLGLRFDFYHINRDFEIDVNLELGKNDYIIINNYYGIKDQYIIQMAEKYTNQCIVDNAQAWYANEIQGIYQFYSPRKFFGLPDGGVACGNLPPTELEIQDYSSDRCSHLLKRIDSSASEGYRDFQNNSHLLWNEFPKKMSRLSQRILSSIDFESAKRIRKSNYEHLHSALQGSNLLSLPPQLSFECPMVYPYISSNKELRQMLIDNKIFVATYWPNVLKDCDTSSVEYNFAKYLLPLPIDQRYDYHDMERIISVIKNAQ